MEQWEQWFQEKQEEERYLCFEFQRDTRRGETITARASAESHLIDISLIYGKALAHVKAEFVIDAAKPSLIQHGAGENERATASTLMAFPFPQCQLSFYVGPSEVNEINSSELADQMYHEMRSLHDLNPTPC